MIDTRVFPLHPRTARRALGWRKPRSGETGEQPIWPIAGGSGEDDPEADPEDDPEADPEDDPEADPWAGKTEAELKAELARLASAHTTAKKQAKNWREKFQGKSTEDPEDDPEDDPKPKTKATTGLSKAQVRAKEIAAEAKVRSELMPVLVATTAESLLVAAGMALPKDPEQRAAKVRRAVRNMDLEDVELVDGKLIGVDEAVNTFKVEYAELFGKTQVRTGRVGNAGGARTGGGKEKTVTELQAEALFGGKS